MQALTQKSLPLVERHMLSGNTEPEKCPDDRNARHSAGEAQRHSMCSEKKVGWWLHQESPTLGSCHLETWTQSVQGTIPERTKQVSTHTRRGHWHSLKLFLSPNTTRGSSDIWRRSSTKANTNPSPVGQWPSGSPTLEGIQQIHTRPIRPHLDDSKMGLDSTPQVTDRPVHGMSQSETPPPLMEASSSVRHPKTKQSWLHTCKEL